MKNQLKVGSVVGIFKTGLVGEVVQIIEQETKIKYHVKVPSEGETYSYSKQDLHLFPTLGQQNIRKEWEQPREKILTSVSDPAISAPKSSELMPGKSGSLLERIKFIAKIMVFTINCWFLTIPFSFL